MFSWKKARIEELEEELETERAAATDDEQMLVMTKHWNIQSLLSIC